MSASALRKHAVAWASLLTAVAVHATSPCQGDACLDDTSAVLVSAIEVSLQRCGALHPDKASEYAARLKKFEHDEDVPPGFLAKLRATDFYPREVAEMQREFDQAGEARRKEICTSVLK